MANKFPYLQPFDVHTPLVDKGATIGIGVHKTHQQYFQQENTLINNSFQKAKGIPASSTDPGIAGQLIQDGLDLYGYNGTNWIKFTGVLF